MLSGSVRYYASGAAVPGAVVTVDGASRTSTETDADGGFLLPLAAEDAPATIQLSKVSDYGDAITSLDAVYILQHVVGTRPLTELQELACDATGDGRVTALDAARVLDLAVGEIVRAPAVESCAGDWIFRVPMGDDESVVAGCEDVAVALEPVARPLDVAAVLPGDCSGNWSPPVASRRSTADRRARVRARASRLRVRGSRAYLPIYLRASAPYHSIDVAVRYDPTALEPTELHLRGERGDPLVQMGARSAGEIKIAIASADPINKARRQRIIVEFRVFGDAETRPPVVETLRLDERDSRFSQLGL